MLVSSLFSPVCGHLKRQRRESLLLRVLSGSAGGVSESLGCQGEKAGEGQGTSSGGCAGTGSPMGAGLGVG